MMINASSSWNGKTVCNESDCNDYVVGDQRTDTWVFASDSASIFTKIINKENLLRAYTEIYDNSLDRLLAAQNTTL